MSWVHIKDTTQKARKAHGCFLCGQPIEVGETYIKRTGTREGRFLPFAMHLECNAETRLWDEWDWDCFGEGDMERPAKPEGGAE